MAISGPRGPQGVQGLQGTAGAAGASGVLAAYAEIPDVQFVPDGASHLLTSASFTAQAGRRYTLSVDGSFNSCTFAGNPTGPAVQFRVNGAVVDYPDFVYMSPPAGQQVTVEVYASIQCDTTPYDFGKVKLAVQAFTAGS